MMHPFQKPRTHSARAERRADERRHAKLLKRGGKTVQQAVADVSRLHAEAHALMWYACECGHRERIWSSRDGVTPFLLGCPSCGATELKHVDWHADEPSSNYTPHEGQRVFVDMTREWAEQTVEIVLARMGLTREHPKFATSVEDLLSHTSGNSPVIAMAGEIAQYAPQDDRI